MPQIEKLLAQISDIVWGPPLLILLVGTHLYLTVRLRFIQRYIGLAIRLSFKRTTRGRGRREPLRGPHHGARGDHRHGQHRRRGHRGGGRRARGRALDVAHRRLRHRHQVRGGAALGEVPDGHDAGAHGRRADVRPRAGPEREAGWA